MICTRWSAGQANFYYKINNKTLTSIGKVTTEYTRRNVFDVLFGRPLRKTSFFPAEMV